MHVRENHKYINTINTYKYHKYIDIQLYAVAAMHGSMVQWISQY